MRICNKCKKYEVRNEKQYTCAKCHNEYQKAYYKKNPNSIKKSTDKRKRLIRTLIINEKKQPCLDCGVEYPYYVMDFDHVRGEKSFNISVAAQKRFNIVKIVEEIAKCDVVCSNCHRERTFNRMGNGVMVAR